MIHRYVTAHTRELGFRIDLEARAEGGWTIKSSWPTGAATSLEETIIWATRYVPWHSPKKA